MNRFSKLITLMALFFITVSVHAQSRGTKGGGVSDALSQMEDALAMPDDDLSPEEAYFLGRAVAANILTRYRLYTRKPALTRYLNQICFAITVNSPMPDIYNGYHVAILDSPDLNAFGTIGGHIFICRGLLEALTSEDAVAAVLAHEIAHIQLRHSAELIKDMKFEQEFSSAAERAAAIANRDTKLSERDKRFYNSVREMVATLFENNYSREQEFAADTYSLKLLATAGYSPASLINVLTLLQKTGGTGGYNSTHPLPAQRINNVRREILRYPVRDTRTFRASRFAESFR
ncbi:peptidase M48 [Spirochaetia bacterium]|nr:peptidase M48 [Spirochaetia bacterium]